MLQTHRVAALCKPLLWRVGPALAHRRGVKATTGIVGVDVDPQAREHLAEKIGEVLEAVKVIPEDAGYRENVEATFQHRLGVVRSEASDEEVEGQFDLQLEQLIQQCDDELGLIPKMAEWKPWDVPPGHTIKSSVEEPTPAPT